MINSIKRKIKYYFFKRRWKNQNKHNYTLPENLFNMSNVRVGNNTYGKIQVYQWGACNEGLEIGNYVSISRGVKFILGGNHFYNTFSTYPFRVKFLQEMDEAYSNGKIIIEDDVWIGTDAIIMSGITIGKGAVIAAGSVVVKNVEPYTIVGGNPAKKIKKRFDDELIEKLLNIDLVTIKKDFIINNIELFYQPLNSSLLEKIIGDINEFKE